MEKSKRLYHIIFNLISVLVFFQANAQKTASVSGLWSNTTTWGGAAVPTGSDDIIINNGISVTIDNNFTTTGSITLNGTGTIQMASNSLSVGNLIAAGSAVINNSGTIANFTVSSTTSTIFSGNISNNINFIKTGNETLTFSNSNTYNGNTSINTGTLVLQNNYSSPSFTIALGAILELNRNSNINYTTSTTFSGNGTIKKTGAGEIAWGTSSATFQLGASGNIYIDEGSFLGGSNSNEVWTNNLSDMYIESGASFTSVESDAILDVITGTGVIICGYSSPEGSVTFGINNGSGEFGGTIADNDIYPASIIKVGSGTITLSGYNTYTGSTDVNTGKLVISNENLSNNINISTGAIFELNFESDIYFEGSPTFTGVGTLLKTGAGAVTWYESVATFAMNTGSIIDIQEGTLWGGADNAEIWTNNHSDLNVANGAAFFSSETNVIVDALTGSGTIYNGHSSSNMYFKFGIDNGTGVFLGTFQDYIDNGNYYKTGNGTQTLSGSNNHSGTTKVDGGILKLNNTSALGTIGSGTTILSGGTIDLNGLTYSNLESLTINGTGYLNGGALINSTNTASYAGLITFGSNTNITTNNQITLPNTISANTYNLTKSGSGTLIFTSNTISVKDFTISEGTLNAGSSTINVAGNFSNSGTFTYGTSNVNINGSIAQTIDAATFYNLQINNTANDVSLNGNISVNNTLTMTSGILNTGSYSVSLGTTGTLNESNAISPSSYITGNVSVTRTLMQNINNTFGGIGLEITEANKTNNVTVVTRTTGTGINHTNNLGGTNTGIKRYFDITPADDAGLNGTMVIHYFDHELGSNTEANLKIYKDSSSLWALQNSSSVNTGSNSISLSNITDFSRWTVSDKFNQPLPVELISFNVSKDSLGYLLNWKTAQEYNNDYFEIEKSIDGINFTSIGIVKGKGTTNEISIYQFVDKNISEGETTYFRLKQVDLDSKFIYSSSIFYSENQIEPKISIYPNPADFEQDIFLSLRKEDEESINIFIFNSSGMLINNFSVTKISSSSIINLGKIFSDLSTGMYILQVSNSKNNYKFKMNVN